MKNNTKSIWKRIAALLAVCIMLAVLPAGAVSAQTPDLTVGCSLRFTVNEDASELSEEADLVMSVYQVADAVANDEGGYDLYAIPPFWELDFSRVTNGGAGAHLGAELADQAIKIAMNNEPLAVIEWGESFEPLSCGAYLCLLHARDQRYFSELTDDTGSSTVTKIYGREHNYLVSPSLVFLPYTKDDPDGTINSSESVWIYDVTASFKPQQLPEDQITVHKRDLDGEGLLAGATFKLYSSAAPAGDDFIPVKTKDGKDFPLFLSYTGTTGDDGSVTFPTPRPDALYALVETEAPAGYVLSKDPYFFYAPTVKEWAEHAGLELSDYVIHELDVVDLASGGEGLSVSEPVFYGMVYSYTFTNVTKGDLYVRAKVYVDSRFEVRVDQEYWTYNQDDGYYHYRNDWNSSILKSEEEVVFKFQLDYIGEEEEWSSENGMPPAALIYECTQARTNPQWKNAKLGTYNPEVLTEPVITIHNKLRGLELPETGGQGNAALYWTGGLLTAGAVLLLADQKRRKKNRI